MNTPVSRRTFIQQSSLVGLGLALPSLLKGQAPSVVSNSNPGRKVGVAVVGTNSRGLSHIQALEGIPGAELLYVCDVEDTALAKGMAAAKAAKFDGARALKDFRKALDDKQVDAITIATPDHWHAPMTLLALAAGKHVYVEKPCSQNPHEGELLLAGIAKYQRLVQMGNQRRSFPHVQAVVKEIHAGLIGQAYSARGWYDNARLSIGHGKAAAVPATLDYDLWQGPAPRRPYVDNLIPYNWHWFWHYGTGEALNNGTHELDVCRWALGVDFPSKVSSTGGRFAFEDDWQTPDTQMIGWEYEGKKAISWEGRSCNNFKENQLDRGVMIYGTQGSVLIDGNSYTVYDMKNSVVRQVIDKAEAAGTNTASASGIRLDRLHMQNFIDAIRTGEALNSPIKDANISVTSLHLGNIAQRTGTTIHCDPSNGHILNNDAAQKLWRRDYEPGWEPVV
jgi:predicted dehydrogenase